MLLMAQGYRRGPRSLIRPSRRSVRRRRAVARYCGRVPAEKPLTIAFVPGVSPDKWIGRWRERHPDRPIDTFQSDVASQLEILHNGRADMSFVRLPVDDASLHVVPLYVEQPVAVVSTEHDIALADEISLEQLKGLVLEPSQVGGEAMAVEVAAAGAGAVILPMSLARLYHRKDVVYRPVAGMEGSRVGLAWLPEAASDLTEEFLGIVRGRTANSSRQPSFREIPAESKRSPSGTGRQSGTASVGKNGLRGERKKPAASHRGGKPKRRRH